MRQPQRPRLRDALASEGRAHFSSCSVPAGLGPSMASSGLVNCPAPALPGVDMGAHFCREGMMAGRDSDGGQSRDTHTRTRTCTQARAQNSCCHPDH